MGKIKLSITVTKSLRKCVTFERQQQIKIKFVMKLRAN